MARGTKTKAQETQQSAEKADLEVIGYKILGERSKSKAEANKAVIEAYKKGFKSAGLCMRATDFVILFGSYNTAGQARANLAAINAAGFNAHIETETKQ